MRYKEQWFVHCAMSNKWPMEFVCDPWHHDSVSGSWEFWALLMRPAAEGKKLFLWLEVLVLMDRSLLPKDIGWNSGVNSQINVELQVYRRITRRQ